MKNFFEEFKKFALKGNVVDLAVAVIIGGAFGKIVTSLVNNIIMPLVGVLLGGVNFSSLAITINNAVITYGVFLQNIVDFLIIALTLFVAIQIMGKFKKGAPQEPEKTPEDIVLLQEIRDLLKR